MPEPWEFVPLEPAAKYLGIKKRTLAQYLSHQQHGLVGARALWSRNGGRPPWLAVRWDSVLQFQAKRSKNVKQRAAAGGRASVGPRNKPGRCPVCLALSQNSVMCDLCQELQDQPYYHRRTAVDAPSCHNGRVLGIVP